MFAIKNIEVTNKLTRIKKESGDLKGCVINVIVKNQPQYPTLLQDFELAIYISY